MLRRHRRFLSALALGILGGASLPEATITLRALVAVDMFSATYLALMVHLALRLSPEELRRHSVEQDEGVGVILAMGVAVVALSLWLVFGALRSASLAPVDAALAAAGIPLAWAMLQTLFAFHYARLHYAPRQGPGPKGNARTDRAPEGGGAAAEDGGIRFRGSRVPGVSDFLYFSFTVGMTSQVSDTDTASPGVRRMVLAHGVLSFFYNAVILALAVNVGASLASSGP